MIGSIWPSLYLSPAVMSRLLSLSSGASDDLSGGLSSLSLGGSVSGGPSSWKVLIYDRYCQDILSPLLTVAELRRLGITLHMPLTSVRERVPDVPAIYLVRPTAENIEQIAKDVRKGIYDSTHLNFSTPISRGMLESLAQQILAPAPEKAMGKGAQPSSALTSGAAAASRIVRVLDQYCEFISLEDQLFTLNATDSFKKLHGASTPAEEAAMFAHVEEMVESLFCVVVSMGVVPIIRAKAGHAAEMVAQKLEQRLREHLGSRNNLFANSTTSALSFHRPLLVLLDRTFDMSAPLLHSWTYQSLLHDLLHMQSNRVTVNVTDAAPAAAAAANAAPPPKPASKPRTYDLLSSEDKFWKHNAGKPFPKVAEAVQERLDAYQKEFNLVTRKAGGNAAAAAASAANGGMDEIASAINSLPKLQRRKKLLDTHMNIATSLLKEIKAREIDVFFDLEQSIVQRSTPDKAMMAAIFGGAGSPESPQGKGTFLDRLRFFLVYFLNAPTNLTEEQIKSYRSLLTSVAQAQAAQTGAGGVAGSADPFASDLAALDYIQHFKFLHRLTAGDDLGGAASAPKPAAASSSSGGMLGGFTKLADSLYGGGVGLLAGVRNLLPTNNHLPITRIVEQLMANKQDQDADKFLYFDPKRTHKHTAANAKSAIAGRLLLLGC